MEPLWCDSFSGILRIFFPLTWVYGVDVIQEGMVALPAIWDNKLRIWNLKTGTCIGILKGRTHWIGVAKISPDGRTAFCGGEDGTLRASDL